MSNLKPSPEDDYLAEISDLRNQVEALTIINSEHEESIQNAEAQVTRLMQTLQAVSADRDQLARIRTGLYVELADLRRELEIMQEQVRNGPRRGSPVQSPYPYDIGGHQISQPRDGDGRYIVSDHPPLNVLRDEHDARMRVQREIEQSVRSAFPPLTINTEAGQAAVSREMMEGFRDRTLERANSGETMRFVFGEDPASSLLYMNGQEGYLRLGSDQENIAIDDVDEGPVIRPEDEIKPARRRISFK